MNIKQLIIKWTNVITSYRSRHYVHLLYLFVCLHYNGDVFVLRPSFCNFFFVCVFSYCEKCQRNERNIVVVMLSKFINFYVISFFPFIFLFRSGFFFLFLLFGRITLIKKKLFVQIKLNSFPAATAAKAVETATATATRTENKI